MTVSETTIDLGNNTYRPFMYIRECEVKYTGV